MGVCGVCCVWCCTAPVDGVEPLAWTDAGCVWVGGKWPGAGVLGGCAGDVAMGRCCAVGGAVVSWAKGAAERAGGGMGPLGWGAVVTGGCCTVGCSPSTGCAGCYWDGHGLEKG